jgi:hypothetical protein
MVKEYDPAKEVVFMFSLLMVGSSYRPHPQSAVATGGLMSS